MMSSVRAVWNVLVTSSVAKRCKNDHSVDIFRIKCCEKKI